MPEVRNMREGSLAWIQAKYSANANGERVYATAVGAQSGLVGFVDSFTFGSAQTMQVQSERGTPNHTKKVDDQPISVTVGLRWTAFRPPAWGITGGGAGATVPECNLEFRQRAPEIGPGSAFYHRLIGVPMLMSDQFTEGAQQNTKQLTVHALAMETGNAAKISGHPAGNP